MTLTASAPVLTLTTGRPTEAAGHWYGQDGTPYYELRGLNGEMRVVTLRDARKLKLVPGFSTIARCEYKPALERWKVEQAYLAVLTLPHIDGETLDEFKARAELDAVEQARVARERGTHLHAAVQAYYEGGIVESADLPFVLPVVEWLERRYPGVTWTAERSFAHPMGYGGKVDLSSGAAVVDFKFKAFGVDDLQKRFAYDEHEMQLHAYERGLRLSGVDRVNLFISSTAPGLIVPMVWPWRDDAWEAFKCLHRLWCLRNRYDPSFML